MSIMRVCSRCRVQRGRGWRKWRLWLPKGSARTHWFSFCPLQEADRRILQALQEEEEEDQRAQVARREQALADVAWMKQVIEEQLQLEREREAELQTLLR